MSRKEEATVVLESTRSNSTTRISRRVIKRHTSTSSIAPSPDSVAPAALGTHSAAKRFEPYSAEQPYTSTKEALDSLLEFVNGTVVRGEVIEYVYADLMDKGKLAKTLAFDRFRKTFYSEEGKSELTDDYEHQTAVILAERAGIKDTTSYLNKVRKQVTRAPIPLGLKLEIAILELDGELDEDEITNLRIRFIHGLNRLSPHLYKEIELEIIHKLAVKAGKSEADAKLFVADIEAKALEERIYTALNYLICTGGFKEIVTYLESLTSKFDPCHQAFMKALDSPLIAELLAKFMVQEDGLKAFSDQQTKLLPHDFYIPGHKYSRRSNIEILLGHYYTSRNLLYYCYAINCIRAVRYAQEGMTEEKLDAFKEARRFYKKMSAEQKAAIQAPDIITCRKSQLSKHLPEDWKTQSDASQSKLSLAPLYLSGLSAIKAYQPDLLKAMSHGDLRACDIQITLIQSRLDLAYHNLTPNNPIKFAAQLHSYQSMLDQQLLIATHARDTNPGSGHTHYGYVLTNFAQFYKYLNAVDASRATRYLLSNPSKFQTPIIAAYLQSKDPVLKQEMIAQHLIGAAVNLRFAVKHQKEAMPAASNGSMPKSLMYTVSEPDSAALEKRYAESAKGLC